MYVYIYIYIYTQVFVYNVYTHYVHIMRAWNAASGVCRGARRWARRNVPHGYVLCWSWWRVVSFAVIVLLLVVYWF